MEIKAQVLEVMPPRTGVRRDGTLWTTIEFVIEEEGVENPQRMLLFAWPEKVPQAAELKRGDTATFCFSHRLSFYDATNKETGEPERRYINELRCWNIKG